MSIDDMGMQEDYYRHYSSAPVIVWAAGEDSSQYEGFIKELNDRAHIISKDDGAAAFKEAIDWAC